MASLSFAEQLAAMTGRVAPPPYVEEKEYWNHVVPVTPKRVAVITMMIPKKEVPAGLQMIQPGAQGRISPKRVEREGRKHSRIDMTSMLSVTSFKSVNIVDYGGMAKVFINLEIDEKNPGINFWDGYKAFLDPLLAATWEKCTVQFDPEKTFVNLSGRRRSQLPHDTEIFFEQHAATEEEEPMSEDDINAMGDEQAQFMASLAATEVFRRQEGLLTDSLGYIE